MTVYTQLPWRYTPRLSVLVGPSEIARVLQLKTPAVVTNWRARSTDFPAERVGGSQPKFDLIEVYEWLRDKGPRTSALPQVSPSAWWRLLVDGFQRQANVEAPRSTMIALLLLRHVLGDDPLLQTEGPRQWELIAESRPNSPTPSSGAENIDSVARTFSSVAKWAERKNPELAGLLVEPLTLDPETAAYLCDVVDALEANPKISTQERLGAVRRVSIDARTKQPVRATVDRMVEFMVAVACPKPRQVVLDPAAGEANLLIGLGRTGEGMRLLGQEIDIATWRIARSCVLIEQLDADLGQPGRDSFREDQHPQAHADLVVVDPPLGDDAPPLERWIEYGLAHLAPTGRLVIVLPLHEIVPVRAARRKPDLRLVKMIQALVSSRAVEGVVVVPRGERSDLIGPVAILSVVHGSTTAQPPAGPDAAAASVTLVAVQHRDRDDPPASIVRVLASRIRDETLAGLRSIEGDRLLVDRVDPEKFMMRLEELGILLESRAGRASLRRDQGQSPGVETTKVLGADETKVEGSALSELRTRYEKLLAEQE